MKKQNGFNLIEVLIVVALITVLIVIGTPSLQYLLISNRITAKTNELVGALNYVRSGAITHSSRRYKMRPRPIPTGTDWSEGWVVWFDENDDDQVDEDATAVDADGNPIVDADGNPVITEGERVLKVFNGVEGIVIKRISGPSEVIRYSSRGKLRDGTDFQFSICLRNRKGSEPKGRIIEIGFTGRVALVDREFDCAPEEES